MTAAVARVATAADHSWLADYIDHCQALGCSDRALRDRLRAARVLLTTRPDLGEWMRRPVAERLITALDAAVRLALIDALSAAAEEITADLAPGSVEVRLRGREPELVVVMPPLPEPVAPPPAPPWTTQ